MDWRNQILSEYQTVKNLANKQFVNRDWTKGLLNIEYAARMAQTYPILLEYVDDDLEVYLNNYVSLNHKLIKVIGTPEKVVFYNGQIIDKGALTEQYLQYFIERNYDVLFIVPKERNLKLGKSILSKISHHENIELFVPAKGEHSELIKAIRQKINQFNPGLCFLHFLPSDVVGFCSFSNILGFKKYFIVHNDHTFWLGKSCADYFIEFRDFGIALDIERRGIAGNRIKLLPFYPINDKIDFEGFPFDRKGKIVGLSGANLYKYLMDPELNYFKEIIKLLKENPKFVFCLCGWGDSLKIEKLFDDNNLKKQFYFLGKRNDFYSLVGQCDILFESYPFKGGLTPLFAIEQDIPVIGIGLRQMASGTLENLIGIKGYEQPTNFSDFYTKASELILSNKARRALSLKLKETKMNKRDFSIGLNQILTGVSPHKIVIEPLEIDDDLVLNNYIEVNPLILDVFRGFKIEIFGSYLSWDEKMKFFLFFLFKSKSSIRVRISNLFKLIGIK